MIHQVLDFLSKPFVAIATPATTAVGSITATASQVDPKLVGTGIIVGIICSLISAFCSVKKTFFK